MSRKTLTGAFAAILVAGTASAAIAADDIKIGNLVDYPGAPSTVSKPFSEGKIDAFNWINAHGGINGKQITADTVDYSYQAPRAIAAYKRWVSEFGAVAIAGWGTADTEALVHEHAERSGFPATTVTEVRKMIDPVTAEPD